MDPPLCGLALISHNEVSDTDLHITTSRGEKVIAIIDNNGYVLSPVPVAPVNRVDTVLLPEGLKALKRVAKLTGLSLHRSYLRPTVSVGVTCAVVYIYGSGDGTV